MEFSQQYLQVGRKMVTSHFKGEATDSRGYTSDSRHKGPELLKGKLASKAQACRPRAWSPFPQLYPSELAWPC